MGNLPHLVQLKCGTCVCKVCLFYVDLIHDVVSMTLFLAMILKRMEASCSLHRAPPTNQIFMLTFFVQNPSRLPIYMMADVIQAGESCSKFVRVVPCQVARKLAQRLRSFRRYRCISMNMELRFPDVGATKRELAFADRIFDRPQMLRLKRTSIALFALRQGFRRIALAQSLNFAEFAQVVTHCLMAPSPKSYPAITFST